MLILQKDAGVLRTGGRGCQLRRPTVSCKLPLGPQLSTDPTPGDIAASCVLRVPGDRRSSYWDRCAFDFSIKRFSLPGDGNWPRVQSFTLTSVWAHPGGGGYRPWQSP